MLIESNRDRIEDNEKEEAMRIADSMLAKNKGVDAAKACATSMYSLKNKLGIIASCLGGRRLLRILSRL